MSFSHILVFWADVVLRLFIYKKHIFFMVKIQPVKGHTTHDQPDWCLLGRTKTKSLDLERAALCKLTERPRRP